MRFSSVAITVAAAASVSAQGVSQISDGQLQAPTSVPVVATSYPVVTLSTGAPVVSSVPVLSTIPILSTVPVVPVPSYPAGNSTVVGPSVGTGSTLVSTASPTTVAASGTSGASASGTGTPVSPTGTAASPTGTGAAVNSFGSALGSLSFAALAMAGFVLA